MYLAETGWKWNQRHSEPAESFDRFLAGCFGR